MKQSLALYRKYRPATFAEVVGQEHVTEPLRTALASGRINHAYLFSGPRGCGKTSSARIMARSLNCAEGPTPDPCGKCGPCQALAPEGPGSVDVTELDAASHGGVDDARELRDRAFYAPAESRYRVFVIDEAHMVTPQGFNALLKIVEEPPEHLIFIFATTEPDKVLTTIRSRTHHYPFRLIPPSAMRELLERNVTAEGVPVEPAVYPLVIRAGGGSARDTQSVLDQLLAGAGPDGVTYDRAVSLLGVTDTALIDAMVDALAVEDAGAVYGTIDSLAEAGHDPRRFATDLLDRVRDLILLRAVPDAAGKGMVSAPEEELRRMLAQAEAVEPGTLTRYAEILHGGLLEMRGATSPRLVLELLCSRMLLPQVSDDERSMLHRLERLERRIASGAPSAAPRAEDPTPSEPVPDRRPPEPSGGGPATSSERVFERPSQRSTGSRPEAARQASHEVPTTPDSTAPEPAQRTGGPAVTPTAGETSSRMDAAALRQHWPQVLAEVRTMSRSTEALLTGAAVHSVSGTTLVLTHPAEPLVRRLSEPRNIDCIVRALGQVVSGTWTVRCVHPSAVQGGDVDQAATRSARDEPPEPARDYQRPSTAAGRARAAEPGQAAGDRPTPSQVQDGRSAVRVTTTEPDIPLPPEPDPEPDDPYEPPPAVPGSKAEDAEAAPADAIDADTRARALITEHLGARPIE